MRHILAALVILAAASPAALASTRSYSLPTDPGKAISACLADGSHCGKPAADQFCKLAGFSESILFQRQSVTSAITIDGVSPVRRRHLPGLHPHQMLHTSGRTGERGVRG